MKKILITVLALVLVSFPARPGTAQSTSDTTPFVRTANYFLLSGGVLQDPDTIEALSRYDLIVLPLEAQEYNHGFFETIRTKNPDIIILAYVPAVSYNLRYWDDPIHQRLKNGIRNDWWLTGADGGTRSVWPDTRALNLNTGWTDYLAQFVAKEVIPSGKWDGIFYDEVMDAIDWVGPIDIDNDGTDDPAHIVNERWRDGYEHLFWQTRRLIGNEPLILTNGSSRDRYFSHVDGRMFETFPSNRHSLSYWADSTRDYLRLHDRLADDPTLIVNVNTGNTGNNTDYRQVRFGLGTTLLGNGFFSYDHGTEDHSQLWWYDEFNTYLGQPKEAPRNALTGQFGSVAPGVWERDFEQGKVVVNATNEPQTVTLDGEYEKIHGTQAPDVNDGSFTRDVTLPPKDGIVLLRPIERIESGVILNGAFARVFSETGFVERNGFFAYESAHRGGTQVMKFDIDLDGARETVVADETWVTIYETDGSVHARFAPYTERYNRGINITAGDMEGDGSVEIVTGTEDGGGPQIRIFNKDGVLINPGFFAYGEAFRGGVNVAMGDLDGDGYQEIVAGAGVGGGPHVRVLNKNGRVINPGFFAYNPAFRGGVNVAAGDVNGDGIDEIVTGPGNGGEPLVRVFDKDGGLANEFYAFDKTGRNGVKLTTTDIDGDGIDEIVGLSSDVFTLSTFFE